MKKNLALGIILTLVLFSSCEKTPTIPNEEELITTLRYTLTPTGGGTPIVLSFQDLDGAGGNAPVITSGTLNDSTTYAGVLELFNESNTPTDTISNEVSAESASHQFFFQSTLTGTTITYNDLDTNGKPLGLVTNLTTNAIGSGTLTITLRHEPNKSAAGVAAGNIANAGGETDIEVNFSISVQ